jgi:amidohydrolase
MDSSKLRDEAAAMEGWLVALRREFHAEPELGLEEHKTAARIERELDRLSIEHERHGTAVVGIVRGAAGGPTVALRADMDALPIQEASGLSYASRADGVMHACGHDAHVTIALGAARWFAEHRDSLKGNVKLLFQPAEESVGGAESMIKAGCMENPQVDFVLGLHVMPYLPVGMVETKKGALNGCSTTLKGRVRGKGGHGAYPESAIDAVLIAAQVIVGLNTLVSRYVSPLESAVITVGTIAGGSRSNIVAEEVSFSATLRATSDELRDTLAARARAVVEGVSAAFGGSGELDVRYGYAALVNHDLGVDIVAAAAAEVLGPDSVAWKEKPSMGVEDFSFFIKDTPGAFYHLGCGSPEQGKRSPLHSSTFTLDEACLPLGVAMQVAATLKYMEGYRG